jgi:hypothetical protein
MNSIYIACIIVGVVSLIILVTLIISHFPTVYNPTSSTNNFPAAADVNMLEPPHDQRTLLVSPTEQLLKVGFNATYNMPITSYIRFDLSKLQYLDPFTTVIIDAKLKLLGRFVFPGNLSNYDDYIITASQIDCDDPNWSDSSMTTFTCLNYDNSTASSILIRGDSIPDFYEWGVTSAVDKVLKDKQQEKQVTFRIAGYPLTASDFNGGVQFWSREAVSYVGSYAGPTETLTITTTETSQSPLSNMIVTVSSIGAIAGVIFAISVPLFKYVLKR